MFSPKHFFFSLAAFPALRGNTTQPGHLRLVGQVVEASISLMDF